ncbi:PhzF family phenazine biosynthesis protein [Brachybacterium paraconglomeratum]|uniref:PhzF family phenazine biosynthesis protein n=1 Tax=Brachybacterium paraconglomeratum TaxID=173362 RepID=UPI0031E67CF0
MPTSAPPASVPAATPRRRPFAQLDVFADRPQRGNPLAVVLEADGLSAEDMQRVARWTNLSETTFLLSPTDPGADYRVRIFTPTGELPFAGHPMLGTARAWLDAGGVPAGERIVQECAAGLIEVRRDGERLAFAAPPLLRSGPLDEDEVRRIAEALGLERADVLGHAWVDNGPGWRVIELGSAARVLALAPDRGRLDGLKVGVLGAHPGAEGPSSGNGREPVSEPRYEVRAFTTGGVEDPVTGSLHAGIAQWMLTRHPMPPRWSATQGAVLGRAGLVEITAEPSGTLWIGGATLPTIQGTILV